MRSKWVFGSPSKTRPNPSCRRMPVNALSKIPKVVRFTALLYLSPPGGRGNDSATLIMASISTMPARRKSWTSANPRGKGPQRGTSKVPSSMILPSSSSTEICATTSTLATWVEKIKRIESVAASNSSAVNVGEISGTGTIRAGVIGPIPSADLSRSISSIKVFSEISLCLISPQVWSPGMENSRNSAVAFATKPDKTSAATQIPILIPWLPYNLRSDPD